MPTEHLSPSHEHSEQPKIDPEVRNEQLDKARERAAERDPADHAEKRAEHARKVIENQPEPQSKAEAEAKPAPPHPIPFLNHHLNYAQTIASVQRKLSPVSRSFSKIIHTPIVEEVSEILERNVARPSVLLGTTWTALIVGSIFYLTAHHYGYALSGAELLFSFIVGALLGLTLEGVWRLLKGDRS